MKNNIDFHIPNFDEFRKGYKVFNIREKKGPIYFESLDIISNNWGNAKSMAEGVSKLIRSWNRFFANFNFEDLVNCIIENQKSLNEFRHREIFSLSEIDNEKIKGLFNHFLNGLKRVKDNVKSPVSVAKAINLLCPDFLPLWDSNIAIVYDCFYFAPLAASPYIRFCYKTKLLADKVKNYVPSPDDRSLLKRIDEYNYSKYSMGWIR